MFMAEEQAQFAFIRHGEAEHNILFRNKTVEEGFKLYDPPLTEKGIRQSEALSAYVISEGLQFDVIVVSCLSRALETAALVFSHLKHARVIVTSLATETAIDAEDPMSLLPE